MAEKIRKLMEKMVYSRPESYEIKLNAVKSQIIDIGYPLFPVDQKILDKQRIKRNLAGKVFEKLVQLQGNNEPLICCKCNQEDPFFGMGGCCYFCQNNFDDSRRFDQLSLALDFICIFIDECDESLHERRNDVLKYIKDFKRNLEESNVYPSKTDMETLRMYFRTLGQIGGNEFGGAIKIPKEGRMEMQMRETNPRATPDAIMKVYLALVLVTNSYKDIIK